MFYEWRPYVSVAQRRRQAAGEMDKLSKKGHPVAPVTIEGRTIASTFWGKSWCDNLERYSDYANRMPRGRTYVRNGSVVHLQVAPGLVTAMVSGSELYEVEVKVAANSNSDEKGGHLDDGQAAGERLGHVAHERGRHRAGKQEPARSLAIAVNGTAQAWKQVGPALGFVENRQVPAGDDVRPPGVKAHAILGLFQIEAGGGQDVSEGRLSALPWPDDRDGGPVVKRGPDLLGNEPSLHCYTIEVHFYYVSLNRRCPARRRFCVHSRWAYGNRYSTAHQRKMKPKSR
jgi:hypothetical protein